MNEEELKGLVHNNRNLVRLANELRALLVDAQMAIAAAADNAVPISGPHEKMPSEYVLSADNLMGLRAAHLRYMQKIQDGWWPDPSPSTLHLQQTCGCCGNDCDPEELEEHIGLVMYCRHCLNNDLAPAPIWETLTVHDGHDCYSCNGDKGRQCPECEAAGK